MIAVLDIGIGDTRSVERALRKVGGFAEVTSDPDKLRNADGLVVPGVGALGPFMTALRAVRGDRIIERRLAGGRPVLGICAGLQVMFDRTTEDGGADGLAQWPGVVDRLPSDGVAHVGWSDVEAPEGSTIFNGVEDQRFYFAHSFAVQTDPTAELTEELFEQPLVTFAEHGTRFVAAVENGPLTATQFHPEKSADAGLELLRNWLGSI